MREGLKEKCQRATKISSGKRALEREKTLTEATPIHERDGEKNSLNGLSLHKYQPATDFFLKKLLSRESFPAVICDGGSDRDGADMPNGGWGAKKKSKVRRAMVCRIETIFHRCLFGLRNAKHNPFQWRLFFTSTTILFLAVVVVSFVLERSEKSATEEVKHLFFLAKSPLEIFVGGAEKENFAVPSQTPTVAHGRMCSAPIVFPFVFD